MSDIPSEIFPDILLRLPAESLFRFRTVCKEWRRLIDDSSFVKSHANNHLSSTALLLLIRNSTAGDDHSLYLSSLESLNFIDDDPQTIDAIPIEQLIRNNVPCLGHLPVASCNGLILIFDGQDDFLWLIWNPLTRECHELPPLPQPSVAEFFAGIGLGYDYATDDYKVVMMYVEFHQGLHVCRTLIYSMKLSSWRMVRDCPYRLTKSSEGVFLNGALHWISREFIIVFDIGNECYRHLPLPPVRFGADLFEAHLDALGGSLIVSYYYHTIKRFDGWVMNGYGVVSSWIKLYSLREPDIAGAMIMLRPIAYLKDKKKVLVQNDRAFFVLDVEDNSVKKVVIHGHSGVSFGQICPGSLFRLGDGGSAAANRTSEVKRKRKHARAGTRLTFCVRNVDD